MRVLKKWVGGNEAVGSGFVWPIVEGQDWKCVCPSNVGLWVQMGW